MDFSNTNKQEINAFYTEIGKKIRKLREERGITQLDLALEIGIKSVAFYSNCENTKYDKHFNLEHLYKISKALDVPIGEFFDSIYSSDVVIY
ncbi:MAG: helix-turn-helix transcriptional regulator [Arcobacteraceae bacterium]|jgi:transcriptional regulator with XRE-family HTH domain|nr:helix-turn-helix transcriptional regulator [Arcobacteraceae bacterium]